MLRRGLKSQKVVARKTPYDTETYAEGGTLMVGGTIERGSEIEVVQQTHR